MKILIVGDSFAADWSIRCTNAQGWPNLLAQQFDVTNIAQAGVGEYKIYKQLNSVVISEFDVVIISHTSPYRITTRQHPVHTGNDLHYATDLIYSDINYHSKKISNFFNRSLTAAINFFTYHYDEEYQETVYKLFRDKIDQLLSNSYVINIDTFLVPDQFKTKINTVTITEHDVNINQINHLSNDVNRMVYNSIINNINANYR